MCVCVSVIYGTVKYLGRNRSTAKSKVNNVVVPLELQMQYAPYSRRGQPSYNYNITKHDIIRGKNRRQVL